MLSVYLHETTIGSKENVEHIHLHIELENFFF